MKGIRGGLRIVAAVATSVLVLSASACGGHPNGNASKPVATTSTGTTSTVAGTGGTRAPQAHANKRRLQANKRRLHAEKLRAHAKTLRPHGKRLLPLAKRKGRHGAAVVVHRVPLCPLTGERAPRGRVPRRAALAVKIENLPQARPQWGLDQADIVFEEPVEGGITRFIAVYQCHTARIEPVRSARMIDPRILEPMGRMLFAYSGAIQPVIDEVDARTSLLDDVGGYKAGNAYWRDPTRYEPHNLETSTAALYAAAASLHYPEKPPTAIFSYGRTVAGATPAAAVSIDFPLDVTTWTWHRDTGVWYRSYSDTGPATLGDGTQVAASNVIVMLMHEYVTQYSEDVTGAHENGLIFKGSGPAWIFRDGAVFFGHWVRPLTDQPTVFIEKKNGARITLTPGNTWVELVPAGLHVSVQP